MESKETQAKQKKEQLFMKSKHGATRISAETQKQSDAFAADYMAFLNASKTEREAAKNAAALLEEKGFVPFTPDMQLKAGDKIYVIVIYIRCEFIRFTMNLSTAHASKQVSLSRTINQRKD